MSLVVYLMRHGIAADPSPGTSDADRALTPEGVRKTARVAVGLLHLGVRPDLILSSPLRRADETARLVADVLKPNASIELYPPLAGGFAPEDIVKGLKPHRQASQLMLVGHQPDLGELASYMLTGSSRIVALPFKKAGVAAIEVAALPTRGPGVLHWFMTPGQLRDIGEEHD